MHYANNFHLTLYNRKQLFSPYHLTQKEIYGRNDVAKYRPF